MPPTKETTPWPWRRSRQSLLLNYPQHYIRCIHYDLWTANRRRSQESKTWHDTSVTAPLPVNPCFRP